MLNDPDVPVKAPVISTASPKVIALESDESNVVPLILRALNTTSPVPPGSITMSELEGDDIVLSFKVKFSTTTPPVALPVMVTLPLVVFVVIVVPSICILSASNTPTTFV